MRNIKKKASFTALPLTLRSALSPVPSLFISLFHFLSHFLFLHFFHFLCLFLFFILSSSFPLSAQTLKLGNYGVEYVDDPGTLTSLYQTDPEKQLLELRRVVPEIVYDLRYTTKNNFTGVRLYPKNTNTTFLRKPAAEALAKVQEELKKENRRLKVFDAYRPYHVTVAFWEMIHDERYVANPSKGSGHNRGLAIDLTVIDLSTGKELDMGTGFDNFSDTAHHNFTALPPQILANRQMLKDKMIKAGFLPFETEWWHYAWPNDRNYEVMNLSFKEVESCCKFQKDKRRNGE